MRNLEDVKRDLEYLAPSERNQAPSLAALQTELLIDIREYLAEISMQTHSAQTDLQNIEIDLRNAIH